MYVCRTICVHAKCIDLYTHALSHSQVEVDPEDPQRLVTRLVMYVCDTIGVRMYVRLYARV